MDRWTDGRIVGQIWTDSELFLNININIYGYGTPDGWTVSLLYIWNLDMDGRLDGSGGTVSFFFFFNIYIYIYIYMDMEHWMDGRTDRQIVLIHHPCPPLFTFPPDTTMRRHNDGR